MNSPNLTPRIEDLLAHQGLVVRLARALVGSGPDADDVVQETWLAAVRRPPPLSTAPRAWIARVTRNLAATFWRRRAGVAARERRVAREASSPSVDEIAAREEVRRLAVSALLALEPAYREPLLLRFYEGLPPRRIAGALGIPVETARTRLRRGIALLRERLGKRLTENGGARGRALAYWAGAGPASAAPLALAATATAIVAAAVVWTVVSWKADREESPSAPAATAEVGSVPPTALATAPKPTTAPRSETAPQSHAEREVVRGRVTTKSGQVPAGARVYLHPREGPDVGMAPGLPSVNVDEKSGEFEIPVVDRERWELRATAPSFVTTRLALVTLPVGEPVSLSLESGRQIHLHVRGPDGGAPPQGRHAFWVRSLFERPSANLWPTGDYAIRPDLWQFIELGASGDADVAIGVPEPAVLAYDAQFTDTGSYTEPGEIPLTPDITTATFTLRRTCRLCLDVRARETGQYPTDAIGGVRLWLTERLTGRRLEARLGYADGSVLTRDAMGKLQTWSSIPPGEYSLRLELAGYETWTHDVIELPAPGDTARLEVVLDRDGSRGRLVASAGAGRSISLAIRRAGDRQGTWTRSVGGSIVLDPAVYDVIAWELSARDRRTGRSSARVGVVRNVDVRAGEVVTLNVSFAPALEASFKGKLGRATAIRSVSLDSDALGALPAVWVDENRISDDALVPPSSSAVLGPYPVDAMTVRVETWDGRSLTWTVSR